MLSTYNLVIQAFIETTFEKFYIPLALMLSVLCNKKKYELDNILLNNDR